MEVIPSIYSTEVIGGAPFYNGGVFDNAKLHQGEVIEIIPPTSSKSLSKKFTEYSVLVSQHEMGTYASKLYKNCFLMNPLAGGGDQSGWQLRASTKSIEDTENSDGSRVLILCVDGSNNQAVIIGGLRDERSKPDDPTLGHHFNWEFNGVNFQVNDDGSWSVVNKGKTDNLGKQHKDANKAGIGTIIKTESNGNITINTKDNNQSIKIDNTDNSITINSDKQITINGSRINLGNNADEPQVLGQQLVGLLQDLISAITSMSMFSFGIPGPVTSPPLNAAQFAIIAAKLQTILSNQSYVKR